MLIERIHRRKLRTRQEHLAEELLHLQAAVLPIMKDPSPEIARLQQLIKRQIDEIDRALGKRPDGQTLDRAGMARLKMLKARADAAR